MQKFNYSNLIYLIFPLIGIALSFFTALGTPGNLDESNAIVKKASMVFNTLFSLSWSGIPLLIVVACVCFYFNQIKLGKIICISGFLLGLACLISLVVLYKVK